MIKTEIKTKYTNAKDFFNLVLALLKEDLKEDEAIFEVGCDFPLYFILLESRNIPTNYVLNVENISSCAFTLYKGYIHLTFYCFNADYNYGFDIFTDNFIDGYLDKGIDFRIAGNEKAIVAINKESAIWRINDLRKNNIKDLMRDIETVESHFSSDVNKILKS